MSALSRSILARIRGAKAKDAKPHEHTEGLPPEVFAQYVLEDDEFRDQILRGQNG